MRHVCKVENDKRKKFCLPPETLFPPKLGPRLTRLRDAEDVCFLSSPFPPKAKKPAEVGASGGGGSPPEEPRGKGASSPRPRKKSICKRKATKATTRVHAMYAPYLRGEGTLDKAKKAGIHWLNKTRNGLRTAR